ncbi:MAG: 6-phosphogluconolactonase [Mesorhizobium sp.]
MKGNFSWHGFATRDELASAFAAVVASHLAEAIAERGEAFLAVSGGTTPAKFFAALSTQAIAWEKVIVTLIDERFVPATSERSNAALVAGNLLQHDAAAARFVPLYHEAENIEAAAAEADHALRKLAWPLDAAVLGMGNDGHTASFFPDAANLPVLLDPASQRTVLPVHAASAGEPRLTLSMTRIVEARFLALHIEGTEKRATFEGVMEPGPAKPIRTVIDASPKPVEVFWAP